MGGNVNPQFQPGMNQGQGQMMQQQQQPGMHPYPAPGMYQQGPPGQEIGHPTNPAMQGQMAGPMAGQHVAGGGGPMIPTTIPGQQQHPPPQIPPNAVPFGNLSTSQLTRLGMEHVQDIVTRDYWALPAPAFHPATGDDSSEPTSAVHCSSGRQESQDRGSDEQDRNAVQAVKENLWKGVGRDIWNGVCSDGEIDSSQTTNQWTRRWTPFLSTGKVTILGKRKWTLM